MKTELDEITKIIMEYDTADNGGFAFTSVKEIAERYARIQIQKDRERVKAQIDITEEKRWIAKIIDETPIILD